MADEIIRTYHRYISKKILFIAICIVLSVIAVGLEISFGQYNIGFFESYGILADHISGNIATGREGVTKDYVVWSMRLPRAIGGLAVGATLGVCGAAMQSALKNPLADPYTTGISSGASLGAAVSIILGICIIPTITGDISIVVNAFLFSLIPAGVIILVTKMRKVGSTSMIMTGIAVMYIFSATTSLLMFSANPDALAEVYIWTVGTLGRANWTNLPLLIVAAATSIVLLQTVAKKLNILVMSDENATSLGINAKHLRLFTLAIVSLGTSIVVSFTGTIGFVGLVAPHVVRIFIGSDNRYLIPASAAFGAVMLLFADCVAKEVGTTGLPVGVITALIGGPLFLILLMRQHKSIWG
ncbi:MAG: iron ABC transporter permease [Candidatus Methanoplasma sp.]|nr:iron ABC transporter permease [Candidatus Methanoplasma sp.]